MKLYHGSYLKIPLPEIRVSNRLLDYGMGFYTTIEAFELGDYTVEEAILRLKAYTLIDQFVFKSHKAIKYLVFQDAVPAGEITAA